MASRPALSVPLMGFALLAAATAQAAFPYVAYVTADTVVRSGPGTTYYPTAKAPRGLAVEVYRHDADGWCAIRPLKQSYSLVPAPQVRRLGDDLAEITSDRAVVRVASSLNEKRGVAQVILTRGEVVRLASIEGDTAPEWVPIDPPAGEFRWVAAADLSRRAPGSQTAGPPVAQSSWKPHRQGLEFTPHDEGPAPTGSGFAHLLNPAAEGSAGATEPLDIVPGSPAEKLVQTAITPTDAGEAPHTLRVRIPGAAPLNITGQLEQQINAVELRLSAIVVEPKQQWDFADVRAAAAGLLLDAKAPAEKARVRELMDRIELFAASRMPTGAGEALPVGSPLAEANNGVTPITGAQSDIRQRAEADLKAADNEPKFDAVGRLRPVVSRREGAPRFALVDEKGEVVAFITPGADLNLQPYLGRRIGVTGQRGFMPEFRRAHVAANRVTPLTGTVLR